MVSTVFNVLTSSVVLAAAFYLKGLIFDTLGYGRDLSSISSFNIHCEKLENLGLEGCEDMWMHEPSGLLYLACSNSLSRTEWFPPSDHLNASGRLSSDRIAILDTRASGPVSERLRWMTTPGFSGNHDDGALYLHGIDIKANVGNPQILRLLLVNHRPPMDSQTGSPLDATKTGANSTIEIFESVLGETTMKHMKTYFDPVIETPNDVAWVSDDSFVFTNDRSGKVGFRRFLDIPLKRSGSVGYCNPQGCRLLTTAPQAYPNGIIRGQDRLIYVANSATGNVRVYRLEFDSFTFNVKLKSGEKISFPQPAENFAVDSFAITLKLTPVDKIKIPHPIDNLSIDSYGNIFVASFPRLHRYLKSTKSPFEILPPTAVWRIRKNVDSTYQLDKVLEDNGSILPSATTVVHDPQTGKMFLGAFAPFIIICQPR